MKSNKIFRSVAGLAILALPLQSTAQILPETAASGGGYMIGDYVEVGVNWGGHEGTWIDAVLSPNQRGEPWNAHVQHGFVSNPAMDGWVQYDGDFFSPGSPENGFGLEFGGVSYSNNAVNADWWTPGLSQENIVGDIISYAVTGDCIEIAWQGMILGVQVDVKYKLVTTELYYTTQVTLTNTTAADILDMYYYRNFDPDNNEMIWWDFVTTNTIVAQPDATCEIALVSAEQFLAWDNYIGLGAVGPNFRVTYGGFTNRDASDIYLGIPPFVQLEGSVEVNDIAISLGYFIDNLEAGTSETFQFAVIMSSADVDAAMSGLYYFDYAGAGGVIDECNPVIDTIQICAGQPTVISIDGPSAADYTWDWTPAIDITPTTGVTVTASPTVTTTYTVTGTPAAACLSTTISKDIVVEVIPAPILDVIDPGPQCGEFDLTTLIINDLAGLPGTFTTFYSVPPDSADQVAGVFPGPMMYDGDDVWILMGEPVNECFDSLQLIIDFSGSAEAGPDATQDVCNTTGSTLDVSTLLVGAEPGGAWTETSGVPSGAFDAITSILTTGGLTTGTYIFQYVAFGLPPCDNDTAYITVNVSQEVTAGLDNSDQRCNSAGEFVDMNTLLSGADPGGYWTETTVPVSGSFVPATGIFTATGVAGGVYTFTYTVPGTAPCPDDVAIMTITVNAIPNVVANPSNPGADIERCEGQPVTLSASGAGAGGAYVWTAGAVQDVPFVQPVGTINYIVTGTDANGCVNTDNVNVVVYPTPILNVVPDTTIGCTPFKVVFQGTSAPVAADCSWDFGDGNTSAACGTVSNTYKTGGEFDVTYTVTDVNGCTNTITFLDLIKTAKTPVASFTHGPEVVFTEDPTVNFTNTSLYSDTYEWDFFDGSPLSNETNPTHVFPDDMARMYYVKLTASNYLGCTDVVTKPVKIDEWIIFFIPNIFTPDGDALNQSFKPVFYSGVDPFDYHMQIFNRYGEIIWESFDFTKGWDGTYGDRGLIQDGTYVWAIEFGEKASDKKHKHHGHVTILK